MTISDIPFDRPEIIAGFCVIFCLVECLSLLRTSLKVSSEIFTPLQVGPALEWIFGLQDLPHNFTVASAIGKMSETKISPFQIPPANIAYPRNKVKTFLPN